MSGDGARKRLYGALGALLCGAGALWWLARPAPPRPPGEASREEAPEPVIVRTAPAPRTELGTGILGINEGISLPSQGFARLGGGKGTLKRRVGMVKSLGARLVRANSHAWPNLAYSTWKGSYVEADRFVQTVGEAGLDAVVVIGPWPGTRTALYTTRYVPEDMDGYLAWVEALVERYDGDGVDDMPGLVRPILAWQVDNEPDQHHLVAVGGKQRASVVRGAGLGEAGEGADDDEGFGEDLDEAGEPAPPGDRTPFQTPQEYAKVLVATAKAIRRADPEARIVSAGIYRSAMPLGREYLAQVLAEPGVVDSFDVLALHCYFASDNLSAVQRAMRTARALVPDKPVWITETSVPSEAAQPWVDEEWQARMVAGIVGGFLAEGADRIFWHTLADAPGERAGPKGYATNSLFRGLEADGVVRYERKPSGEVFRRVADHLAGLDPSGFAEISADGGRILDTGNGWLVFDGEPVVPPEGRTVEDLVTGEVTVGAERARAPAWIAP